MKLVMMGTGTFAEPTFEALLAGPDEVVALLTQPDRDAGKKSGTTRQTGRGMKAIAGEAGVPVFQPENANAPESVETLRGLDADLFVVAAYGQILSPELLGVPRLGAINVHGSLLPKYRGAAPIAWAIYHGETETGVTIIRMTPKLDGGTMLAKESIAIGPDETAGEVEARLAPIGARLAVGVIDRLRDGPVDGELQNPAEVTKAPKLKKSHGLIDWSRSAVEICRHIRAMQPWPSAYTFWHRSGSDKPPVRLQIVRAEASAESAVGDSGTASATKQDLTVSAGEGAVRILEIQPSGKRAMSAVDFLRGQQVRDGDRFGPETPA